MPVGDLVAFHHLLAPPADQTEHEESIILQHVLDIPPGSTEKLILIDVEMHYPARIGIVPRHPPVLRQVYKTVPVLVRRHILLLTHTAGYCDWHPQECIIHCNGQIWPQQDHGPMRIEHGMYFRITIPPPPVPSWDISHALRVFHDASELFEPHIAGQIAEEMLQAQPNPVNVQIQDQSHGPRSHKGADLDGDIDIPMMSAQPATRLGRRPRPVHDGTDQWLMDLGNLFSEHAEVEVIDGDAYLYIQTWYVDHIRHVNCRSPRPLRLDQCSVAWINEFRHLWRDLLDPGVFFSVHVVKPRPPQFRHHAYASDVLIEQN